MTQLRRTKSTIRSRDRVASGRILLAIGLSACALASGPALARADEADARARIDEARKKAAELYPPCNKKPTDADLKGAKGSHTAAKQFLERGQYDKAIQAWNDAYGFDCSRPSVFANLSNAYERLGDKAMTIAVIEIALDRDPEADKATLTTKVENLRATLASEPKAGAESHGASGKPEGGPEAPKGGPVAAPDKPGPVKHERPFGVAPWVTLGVGGAALVAGIPLLIVGRGKVADAEKVCPTHKLCDNATRDLGNTGNTFTGVGIGLLAGGGAIAIGSLVWQLAGNRERPVRDASSRGLYLTFDPVVSPSLSGAWVTGRF